MRRLRKRIRRALSSRSGKLSPAWQIAALEPRMLLAGDVGTELGVSIDLRGETGEERVQFWAGDYRLNSQFLTTEWQRFDLNVQNAGLEAKDIRVEFLNDVYDPGVVDRNVFVGSLFLNGEEFDPNGEDGFSTATWRPEDGIVAGSGRGSVLNANGYLQFGAPDGSVLTVYARGDEGGEQFSLLAGSYEFAATTVTTDLTAYEFYLNETIDPGSVRVQFLNDRYQPEIGVDFNLTVDRIEIDGASYESEAAETFHTGVFRDGFLQSGFYFTETLQGNGFFQFNNSPQNSPRYAFDESVSDDGLIEFSQGDALRATSFSDGSFVGTTQRFGFGGAGSFQTSVEAYDATGNVDTQFNSGQPINLFQIVQNTLPDSQTLFGVTALDTIVDSQDRVLIPLSITAQTSEGDFLVLRWAIRLTRNGDVDASFGDQGIFQFSDQLTNRPDIYHVDGLDRLLGTDGENIVRLNNIGQLDSSFGLNGVAPVNSPASDAAATTLTTRADHSIMILLTRRLAGDGDGAYLSQFNEDGSVGTWFADSGIAVVPRARFDFRSFFSEQYDRLTLDDQGRSYLTGSRSVLRFTENGQIDASYGGHGLAILPDSMLSDGEYFQFGTESGVVIDAQGRAIASGLVGFIRLDESGNLDSTFSQDGYGAIYDAGEIRSFDVSNLQLDASGRLFSPIRSIRNPAVAVWQLV